MKGMFVADAYVFVAWHYKHFTWEWLKQILAIVRHSVWVISSRFWLLIQPVNLYTQLSASVYTEDESGVIGKNLSRKFIMLSWLTVIANYLTVFNVWCLIDWHVNEWEYASPCLRATQPFYVFISIAKTYVKFDRNKNGKTKIKIILLSRLVFQSIE